MLGFFVIFCFVVAGDGMRLRQVFEEEDRWDESPERKLSLQELEGLWWYQNQWVAQFFLYAHDEGLCSEAASSSIGACPAAPEVPDLHVAYGKNIF